MVTADPAEGIRADASRTPRIVRALARTITDLTRLLMISSSPRALHRVQPDYASAYQSMSRFAVTLLGTAIVMLVASRAETYAPETSAARGPSVTSTGVFTKLWGATTELWPLGIVAVPRCSVRYPMLPRTTVLGPMTTRGAVRFPSNRLLRM